MTVRRALSWLAVCTLPAFAAACTPAQEREPAPAVGAETPAPVDDEEEQTEEPEPEGEAFLHLGYLLPQTGPMSFLGTWQITAVELAVEEVNRAGGPFGEDVRLSGRDEAGDAAVAIAAVDQLLAEGVHAIVGAAASGISLAVIDQITGAGVLQCSPSNTSASFTDYDDGGLYFRLTPSEALQGRVLAEAILADDPSTVVILARDDAYGEALAATTRAGLEPATDLVVETISYDPDERTFTSEVERAAGIDPDAVVVLAYEETPDLLQELFEAGLTPDRVGLYGADGSRDPALPELLEEGPSVLDGMTGTAPDPGVAPEFLDRFEDANDDVEAVYAAPAYDCANLIALAAVAAGSTDGRAMAAEMQGLFDGANACSTFAACRDHLANGETIAYEAAGGTAALTDAGEPSNAPVEVWGFADGELRTLESVETSL